MQRRVFVTGAAGFIGFHLARSLKDLGDEVLGFDNFNDYYSPELKRARAGLLAEKNVKIIEGDICDSADLNQAIEDFQPSHIVHLAAQAGVRYSLSHPQEYIKTNIQGFLNVLENAKNFPKRPVIYASSSSVYGLNENIPFSTNDNTDRQASLYGVTKKSNELMAATYHHLYKIPLVGLRFFTVYGPWGRPDMAYFSFTKAILEGKPIDVFFEGNMLRDFTYIDDIVHGTLAALKIHEGNHLYNLGNHQPVKVSYFIQILEQLLGKKAQKRFLPMQPGDVLATYADIDTSKQFLNFHPKVSLESGLEHFVTWYRHYYKSRV